MPLYEYQCEGGHRFEHIRQMEDRYDVSCLMCKMPVHLKMSLPIVRIAVPMTVYQELPRGQGYQVLDKKPDSADSADRNYGIPPDYPNLIV